MSTTPRQGRTHGATQNMRKRVLSSRDRFWRPSDMRAPESTVQHLLQQLVSEGELRHVRRGLYWRGTKTALGMSPPPAHLLIEAVTDAKGVGPAGLSAANELRLSTQIPRKAQIAVPGRAPKDVGAVKFCSRKSRTGRRTAGLSRLEVALLEALESWETVLEVPPAQAWTTLAGLLFDGTVRGDRLAKAARTEPAPVRVRLTALLMTTGYADEAKRVPTADKRTVTTAMKAMPGLVPAA